MDINDAQAGDKKENATVKVYRNPPTSAELADPRRSESLPPNSLVRPQKRPLPPLFSDSEQDNLQEPIDHEYPLRAFPPVQPYGRAKRQKIETLVDHSLTNSDRPVESLETQNEYYDQSRAALQHPSPTHHASDSRNRKRESPAVQSSNVFAEIVQGSDPYGTPISSQSAPQGMDKPNETEIVSIPESPVSGHDNFGRASQKSSGGHGSTKSKSPELFPSTSRSPQSREASSQLPTSSLPPLQHETEEKANAATSLVAPQAANPHLHGSQVLEFNNLAENPTRESALKTPSTTSGSGAKHSGRLQRPESVKKAPALKRNRKVINGVKQKTPSVFDPIETSEGSTYEREQLRSAKRLKTIGPPLQTPKSEAMQAKSNSKSPAGPFLFQNASHSATAATPTPGASNENVPPTSFQEPIAKSQEGAQAHHVAELPDVGNQPVNPQWTMQNLDAVIPREQQHDGDRSSQGLDSGANIPSSASGQNPGHSAIEQQVMRKAQAEIDRIAATRSEEKPIQGYRKAEPLRIEDPPLSRGVDREPVPPSDVQPGSTQPPLETMTLEARRQWNLEHVVPALNKEVGEFNAQIQEFKKQEKAARRVALRQEKQDRVQRLKKARDSGKKQATEDQSGEEQQAGAEKAANEERQSAEDQFQEKENQMQELKAKVGRERQDQQANARKANFADFPQPTRIRPKSITQPEEPPAKEVAKDNAQNEDMADTGKKNAEIGIPSHVQGQATSDSVDLDKDTSKIAGSEDKAGAQNPKPAPQQGVCNSNQSWLMERSPKAKYNAERQLQLANEWLKQTKRDLKIVQTPRAAAKSTAASSKAGQSQKAPREDIDEKKQRQEDQNGVRRATIRTFNDSEALKAAGISAKLPTTSTARKEAAREPSTSDNVKPIAKAHRKRIAPGKSQLLGILKAVECKSSSPANGRSDSVRVRSMTPAIPNSSTKINAASAEAKPVGLRRAATLAPEALKTPIRNASQVPPTPSQRSVSFANDLLPSTQTQKVNMGLMTQVSGVKKGILYRALEESNTKRAEEANEQATPTFARPTNTLNKVTQPPTKAKQTKLTQHISRDTKLKGKAVDRPPRRRYRLGESPTYSSSSGGSTFSSDESEGERNARAGPSSTKKVQSAMKSARALHNASNKGQIVSDQTAEKLEDRLTKASGTPANTGTQAPGQTNEASSTSRPAMTEGAKAKSQVPGPGANAATTSGKTITITLSSSSSSSSYAGSEVESALGQTDDVALLPQVNMSSSTLGGSSQRSGQKNAAMAKGSSQANLRSSLVPKRSSTPQHQTHHAKMARLSSEQRMSQEADRQLQREHVEALKRKSAIEAPAATTKTLDTPGREKASWVPLPAKNEELQGSRAASKRAVNVGFGHSSLSMLRHAQAATKPAVMQSTAASDGGPGPSQSAVELPSSDDSESDDSASIDTDELGQVESTHQQSQGSSAAKRKIPFGNIFTELFGSKK